MASPLSHNPAEQQAPAVSETPPPLPEKSGEHLTGKTHGWKRGLVLVGLMMLPGIVEFAVDFARRHEQILHMGRRNGAMYAWWAILGATLWGALGLSAIVFSGAAQILAVQLLAAGAPLAVIVLTCFVAGLRFVIYSAAMAPYLRSLPPRWQQGLAFLLTDQAFAAAIRRLPATSAARCGD